MALFFILHSTISTIVAMEDGGYAPPTGACKAPMFLIIPIPHILTIKSGFSAGAQPSPLLDRLSYKDSVSRIPAYPVGLQRFSLLRSLYLTPHAAQLPSFNLLSEFDRAFNYNLRHFSDNFLSFSKTRV